MSPGGEPPSRRKLWKYVLVFVGVVVLVLAGLAWYTTTESFQAMVHRRLVTELETVTGGRVELGSFHTVPFQFQVEVRDLTIHGKEAPGEVPYAHVDRLVAKVKIISVLGAEFGFHSLTLDRPVVHVIFYSDGSTNVPDRKARTADIRSGIEQLTRLSITRLQIQHGEILWGDRTIPLDVVADDVSADMVYSLFARRYDIQLRVGKIDTVYEGYRPVAWTADGRFSLSSRDLQVKSLTIASKRSNLEMAGTLTDLNHPGIQATYKGVVDLGDASAVVRSGIIRKGMLEADGKASWTEREFSTEGKLSIKELDASRDALKVSNGTVSSQFKITSHQISLSQIQASLLGGSVSGDADVTNWQNVSIAKTPQTKVANEQRGVAHFRFRGLSAGDLIAAISAPQRPLHRLNLAGDSNGTINVRWTNSIRNSETEIAMDVAPPAHLRPGQLPLTARVRGTYRAAKEDLNLEEFSAKTRNSEAHATGSLASKSAVRFSVATSNLDELQPLVAMLRRNDFPLVLHGRASLEGTAAGRISDLAVSGNLQASNFDVVIPAAQNRAAQSIHWDSAAATVQLSREYVGLHNITLTQGDTEIHGDLALNLQRGELTDQSPFNLRVAVHKVNVADVLTSAGYSYPVTGVADFQLHASGTRISPRGEGHLELRDGSIHGQPVQSLTSDVQLADGEIEFSNLHLKSYGGEVAGTIGYNSSAQTVRFDVSGRNFQLAKIPMAQQSNVAVAGVVNFTAQGSGTLKSPQAQAHVQISDLVLDRERIGGFVLDAATHGADLSFTGRSHFEQQAELTADGKAHLEGDWPSSMQFKFTHLDADSLLRTYFPKALTNHSTIAGTITVEGPLRKPKELIAKGDLSGFEIEVENVKLTNQGPLNFSVNHELLKLDDFHLVGERTDFKGKGELQLSGDHKLRVQADGRINLRLIESLNRDFTSSGILNLHANVTGTLSQPVLEGRMDITRGAIAYVDLPSGLSEINGSILFNQNRMEVDNLTARVGGGNVTLKGYATFYNRELHFDLGLVGQEVRLRYPPGVSSTANVEVRFAGTPQSSTLSGDVTVTKLSMTPGFDFGAYLQKSVQSTALPQTNPLLNRIRLDLHIQTTPELQMQTASVRLSGDADLRLRGTAAKPSLLGRADILEGEVYFNGTKYHLERGDVTFLPAGPVVDLQASTRVRDYDITLTVSGEADRLNLTYRSEPPLPSADIVSLLALGRTRQESAQLQNSSQSPFAGEASNAILNEALNAAVSNRVQRLFGGSRVKIDPEGLTTETSTLARGPAVTIEQQVAGNLTLTYTTNISQASQQIIQAEYNVSRNVSIVALRDQNGVLSFDVRIRRRKK